MTSNFSHASFCVCAFVPPRSPCDCVAFRSRRASGYSRPNQYAPGAEGPNDGAVRQAALDYVQALYRVDSTRIVRSVHPDLVKYGYYSHDSAYRGTPMTYAERKQLTMNWNKDQQRVGPDRATKDIVVLDMLDKTASTKVVARWGVAYMHLAKVNGRWMIRQIPWQSPSPSK